jgi:tellurite resistance protein TehA-like permease
MALFSLFYSLTHCGIGCSHPQYLTGVLMFVVLGLLCAGIGVGCFLGRASLCKKLERSISYTIFAMLFIFGMSIGANKSLLADIGQFGVQAVILAVCGVAGSLVASYFAYCLFAKKEGGKKDEK